MGNNFIKFQAGQDNFMWSWLYKWDVKKSVLQKNSKSKLLTEIIHKGMFL